MELKEKIILKSAINRGLSMFEKYWKYREDKKSEILEVVFKEIENEFISLKIKN